VTGYTSQRGGALARRFCTSDGQLLAFTQTGSRPDDGAWAKSGTPFKCCLYGPKGDEIPEALSLTNREVYWLAYSGSLTIKPPMRAVISTEVYKVHTSEARSNLFLPRVMVSHLGPYLNASTGYPEVYEDVY
jgi:hypothetical protein